MRIAIFGAAGRTGKHLVEQALAAGHEVIAFVRDPSRLSAGSGSLTVIQGDATDVSAVERAVRGADAVISVMATSASGEIAKTKPLTRATRNILDAMEKHGLRRLVISSAGLPQPEDRPDLRFRLLMGFVRFIVPASAEDTAASVRVVRASHTDWTIVRMTAPTNALKTGRVRAGYVDRDIGMRISRADAAAFMLDEAQAARYVRQAPVICNH